MRDDFLRLPEGLPVPADDGACDHLPGLHLPSISLPSTLGVSVNVADASRGLAVFFFYPRTGRPDEPAPQHWDEIPGARGCTPQSCAFRDLHAQFRALGAEVYAVSTVSPAHQAEFASRMRMTMPHLSDERFELVNALRLPTFEWGGARFVHRLALVAERGAIVRAFYPVFPPDRNAPETMRYLRSRA